MATKQEKKYMHCRVVGFENKEFDSDGNLIKGGYIATTHIDSGWYDAENDRWIRDRISKETLDKWAEEINSGNPRANKLSVNHNRVPHVAGVMIKGSAKVEQLPDGEWGLYVDTLVDKTREDFEEIKYRIENGLLDSFSIEYTTRNPDTGEYMPDAVRFTETPEGVIRTLLPNTILEGATYASQPMNEHAIMIKEIQTKKQVSNFEEIRKKKGMSVSEFYAVPRDPPSSSKLPIYDKAHVKSAMQLFSKTKGLTAEERRTAINKIIKAAKKFKIDATNFIKKYKNKEATKMVDKKEEEQKPQNEGQEQNVQKPDNEVSEPQDKGDDKVEDKEIKLSKEDLALLKEAKEMKAREEKEKYMNEVKSKIIEELKKELASKEVKSKVQNNKEVESKEVKEFKNIFELSPKVSKDGIVSYDIPVAQQFKIAGKLAEKAGLLNGEIKTIKSVFDRKYSVETKGRFIEAKGLGLDTNSSTDYYLSAAELNDIFDPIIYNGLNEKVTTWNLIDKLDYSNKGNNKVQFTVKTSANDSVAWYTDNTVGASGNTGRTKYETKFKKIQVVVEVDGDMIAAAKGGPIGDVFAQEIQDATDTLMSAFNQALFVEKGAETDAEPIGFPYITDSAGNTVLYGKTRSSDPHLHPSSATDTYINANSQTISLSLLRKAKRQAVNQGASIDNLVWITSYEQADVFRGLYDSAQRLVPTSSRFGFEGRPEFDGIPIFEDKDCPSDSWFLIDLETVKIAMWVPPTLEMLGKTADSVKGFIKSYWALFSRAPNRMVQIYGCATE